MTEHNGHPAQPKHPEQTTPTTPEQELKLAQERFNIIYQNTTVSIWDYIFATRQIIQPERSRQLHGMDTVVENVPDSLIESGYVHPDSAPAFRAMYDQLLAGAPHAEGVFRVKTADGSGYWYEHIRYTTLFDDTGTAYAAIGLSTDITQQTERELALQRRAETDNLTGLLNHSSFLERAQALWATQPDRPHLLLLLDLDNFKELNNTHGHAAGDKALKRTAACLQDTLRTANRVNALAARTDGDEFAVFFYESDTPDDNGNGGNGTPAAAPQALAEQFARSLLQSLHALRVEGVRLSASVGMALAPRDGATLESLSAAADRALYYMKQHGKGDFCFYDDIFQSEAGWLRRRQQLMADTLEGGMVGGYLEEGFPYYFVDASLLKWLGYESEADFIRDIDGLILNSIHPGDREYVNRVVGQQLDAGGRYEVDYRMKKQDGSYIWVHDIGEAMTAPDGRAAITSVCYDITREKEHNKLIDQLVDDLEARIGLYRVEAGTPLALTLLHASENIMAVTHYSDEEYWEICREDAIDFVYIPDRKLVRGAITRAVTDDTIVTEHFRLCNKRGGFTWVTGVISRLGSDQDRPVVRIIFMPFSIQSDLQLQMLDSKYMGVYVIDEETEELYFANNTILQMYGVQDLGFAGRSCHDVFFGRDTVCTDCWRRAEHTGDTVLQERNGRVFSMEVQRRVWNGRSIVIVYTRDITEQYRLQKQQEARLEAERRKALSSRDDTLFYYIANVTQDKVVEYRLPGAAEPVTDRPMELHTFVASGCRSIGSAADREMMVRRHDRAALLEQFRRGVTGDEFDVQFTLTGGITYWAQHKLTLLQEPVTGDVYLYEYVYDVSQEKIMDLMLRYEMSHGCEAVGFWAVDSGQFIVTELDASLQGKWCKVSAGFEDYMRRYAAKDILPEDREKFLQHYLNRTFAADENAPVEIVYRCERGGKIAYLSGSLHCYRENGSRFAVLIRRNVTELIQSEEEKNRQLSEALDEAKRASRAKTDFLSRMSHDIRTPLNGVIGMTEIALSENTDPRLQADLETIASSGKFLLSLINDILDISRIESGKLHLHPAPVELDAFDSMIDAVVRPLMREKQITFDYRMNCGLRCAMLDEVRFNQVFFNLLSNAAKFTPEHGHVSFTAHALSSDETTEWVRFSVKDDGIGMSAEFLQRAFEPFEQMYDHGYGTQQRQGTGLGLAIVRELVALMGGKITVTSEPGGGSEFLVDLPLQKCAPPQQTPAAVAAAAGNALAGKHVLLVEDNGINLQVATRLLEARGVQVTAAANGRLGLETFETAAPGTFDAILMDVRMPVMDGLEATRRLRALNRPDAKTIPILAMSANAYEEDRQKSLDSGMNGHLSKPVEPEVLYRTLAGYLG